VLSELDDLLGELLAASGQIAGVLRIGMYTPVNAGPSMVAITRAFEERHPACRVEFVDTGLERDPLDWLRRDEVDMLAMRLPLDSPDVVIGPLLSREPRLAVLARNHELAAKPALSIEDLADCTMQVASAMPRNTMDAIVPPVTPAGQPIRREEVRTPSEALMRVAAGQLVYLTVPSFLRHYHHPEVIGLPVTDLPPSPTALVWLAGNESEKLSAFARITAQRVRLDDEVKQRFTGR
jgi:DNA-binding transcriptional LysR family regulator